MSLISLKRIAVAAVAAAALAVGSALPAGATLIGSTVTVSTQHSFPEQSHTDIVLVDAGAELVGGDGSNHSSNGPLFPFLFGAGDTIDIGDASVTFTFEAFNLGPGQFLGFTTTFSDLDWGPGFENAVGVVGVTLDDPGGVVQAGWQANLLNPNAKGGTRTVQFQGAVDILNGANFTLNFDVDHTPIPLPAGVWLFMSALGGLGLFGWRRRRAAA